MHSVDRAKCSARPAARGLAVLAPWMWLLSSGCSGGDTPPTDASGGDATADAGDGASDIVDVPEEAGSDDGADIDDTPQPIDAGSDATDSAPPDVAADADADAASGDAIDVAPETDTADATTPPDSDSGSDGPDAADTPWIRVGTGYDPFEEYAGYTRLEPGDAVRIAEGPQGGFHVWGGFEGAGMALTDVGSEWTLTGTGGEIVGAGFLLADMLPFGDHLATAGLTVFLEVSLDVTTLDGPLYELCVTVYLDGGDTLTDCQSVTTSCCDYL